MFNPLKNIKKSKGIDIPLMYIYLAGYMSGEKLAQCTEWRKRIREHYGNYEETDTSYPFSFLDPFNGAELETIDKKGLTSSVSGTAIINGDRMSVNKSDVIIANMDDFFMDDIQLPYNLIESPKSVLLSFYKELYDKVAEKRDMIGTHHELRWGGDQNKPRLLIVPENKKEMFMKHPFTKDCDYFFTSVQELLDSKVLESFYKRIAGAIY